MVPLLGSELGSYIVTIIQVCRLSLQLFKIRAGWTDVCFHQFNRAHKHLNRKGDDAALRDTESMDRSQIARSRRRTSRDCSDVQGGGEDLMRITKCFVSMIRVAWCPWVIWWIQTFTQTAVMCLASPAAVMISCGTVIETGVGDNTTHALRSSLVC